MNAHLPIDPERLRALHCAPLGPQDALSSQQLVGQLALMPRWHSFGAPDEGNSNDRDATRPAAIEAHFEFTDYYRTLAFVNAIAWIAHAEDHHPDLIVGYGRCTVRWSTHSAGGVTLNDLCCAARCDAVFDRH